MSSSEKFPEPRISIPENSDAFKDWERRRDAGELEQAPSESTLPTDMPEIRIGIPENSDAFKEWGKNRDTNNHPNS